MKVEEDKFYTCLRGNYTHDTIVKVLESKQYESQAMIVSLLSSKQRSEDAMVGQIWNVNNDWLVPIGDTSNPNLLFSLKKAGEKP
jgi:hypothetical protein